MALALQFDLPALSSNSLRRLASRAGMDRSMLDIAVINYDVKAFPVHFGSENLKRHMAMCCR
jgi:hypothetical protein